MSTTVQTVPEWFMLNGVEVGSRAKRILGAVVPNHHKSAPFLSYRPNYDHLKPKDLESVENLWAKVWKDDAGAVPIDHFVDLQHRVQEDSAGISVQKLLRTFAKQKLGKDVEIIGGSTKRYTIDNADSEMEDTYVECDPWFNEVKKLYNKNKGRQLFFVTGVQVCWDLKVRYDEEKLVEVEASAAVPNAAVAAGHPVPGKLVEINGKRYRSETHKTEVTFNDRVVLAVRYHNLVPKTSESSRKFLFFKSEGQLTGFDVGGLLRGNLSNYAAVGENAANDFYSLPQLYVEAEDEGITDQASPNRHHPAA